MLLRDIWPGSGTSDLQSFVAQSEQSSTLYFVAQDDTHGYELWRSDGAPETTVLVKDIYPGGGSPEYYRPTGLSMVNNHLLFTAVDPNHGRELWRSDGSATGTQLVKDIVPGQWGGVDYTVGLVDSSLYFVSYYDSQSTLWKSDGTESGTVQTPVMEAGLTYISSLIALRDTLLVVGDDSTHGRELWATDGTAGGTALVKDIGSLGQGSYPWGATAVGNVVYFTADDGHHGRELWQHTSSGVSMVKDITPGPDGYLSGESYVLNSRFYFIADDSNFDYQIWQSDGTAAGTVQVTTIPGGMRHGRRAVIADTLYFVADDGVHGYELWKFDSTTNLAQMVKDVTPDDYGSLPTDLVAVGDTLYFAINDGNGGKELWKSNGTDNGTTRVKAFPAGGYVRVEELTALGDILYFSAHHPENGMELWRSDGTTNGTYMVKDIRRGSSDSYPTELTAVGSWLYFVADDGSRGAELWRSDGTTAGTQLVKDIRKGARSSEPMALTAVGDTLYLVADDLRHGQEVWVVQGKRAKLLKDIAKGRFSSEPNELRGTDSLLYFVATDPDHGRELWQSNGRAKGTKVIDLLPGPSSSVPLYLSVTGDRLYFSSLGDIVAGYELWALDLPAAAAQPAASAAADDLAATEEVEENSLLIPDAMMPLVANDDAVSVVGGTPLRIGVLANDSTINGPITTAQVALSTDPITGTATVEADGTITYVAPPVATGEDAFEYTVCSEEDLCETATVIVTLLPTEGESDLTPRIYLPFVQR